MTNEEYWAKRQTELEEKWNRKNQREIERHLRALYKQSLQHIEEKIQALYTQFAADNALSLVDAQQLLQGDEYRTWRMDLAEYVAEIQKTGNPELLKELNTLAARSRITRLDKLQAETIAELGKLAGKQKTDMDDSLSSAYQDFYYRNLYEIGRKIGLRDAVTKVDTKQVEDVLRTPWSGKNYSERIWTNSRRLANTIQREIVAGVHRGATIQDMSRIVQQRMNVGRYEATRLVRTEMNYVENRAALDSIKESGMKFYQFVATLDRRTSSTCREHDGKVYPVDDYRPGTNAPPLHPHCRSVIIGSVRGTLRTSGQRAARTDEGKYTRIPASVTYKEWEKGLLKPGESVIIKPRSEVMQVPAPTDDTSRFYKAVQLSEAESSVQRGVKTIKAHQVENSTYDVFVSEEVTLKPRMLHELEQELTQAYTILDTPNTYSRPSIYVISNSEMQKSAVAAFAVSGNRIYMDEALLKSHKEAQNLQKDFAASASRTSTLLHELYHWLDSQVYTKKYGAIIDFDNYQQWVENRAKRQLQLLLNSGFDLRNISKYASESLRHKDYDEVYTEYRVKKGLSDSNATQTNR